MELEGTQSLSTGGGGWVELNECLLIWTLVVGRVPSLVQANFKIICMLSCTSG